MKQLVYSFIVILITSVCSPAFACSTPASVCTEYANQNFVLIKNSQPASVIVEKNADPAVQEAAKNFAKDLQRVSGKKAKLLSSKRRAKNTVIIGVLGQSKIIDELVKANKLDVSGLADQWEAFHIAVVKNPWPNVNKALVIVGSDRRGAIFGTYDLSEQMGVSPWYWFADVAVAKKKQLYVSSGSRRDQPKVKYRGLFINDEDPALSGWAKKHFSGVNSDMYKHVFELILRLKGNYIWPAMWGKAIHFDDPRSTALADNMGIVLGTSHHEPMTRAQAEWHKYPNDPTTGGAWDYATNGENLRSFWKNGIERMMSKGDDEGYESLVTVGMRGDGDEPMSEETATELLEKIVNDQRKIIAEVTGKPAEKTPQVWALYKEVQEYYDEGMTVPDDVTLLFADDNWGQIRRLPTKDVDREGGFGVYYHFDYVGVPRNYKWLNTTQVSKVWQQMDLAYQRGAKDIWIVNVGDIKPMEYPLDFFMEMAWNPEKMDLKAANAYPKKWASDTFGAEHAADIAKLVTDYSRYASRRKPELINEETFAIGEILGKELDGGEMGVYINQWRTLVKAMEKVKQQLNDQQQDAFFQLVEYPILALSNLYEMYNATAWNRKLIGRYDARSVHFLREVERTFARDSALTEQYHQINEGKWDGMMNQVHMNYFMWNDPTQQTMPSVVRIFGGSNNIPVKFKAENTITNDVLNVEAANYSRTTAGKEVSWAMVPDLGQVSAAMIAYPQGKPSNTLKEAARLEYDFSSTAKQNLIVELTLSPTLDTIGQGGIKIGVAIDNQAVQILNLNLHATGGGPSSPEKQAWYDAVINHSSELSTLFNNIPAGKHTLKVLRLDDNVILENVTVKVK